MAKRSLLSRCPSYNTTKGMQCDTICAILVKIDLYLKQTMTNVTRKVTKKVAELHLCHSYPFHI